MDEVAKLQKRLVREKLARKQAEDLLEQKAADLFEKNRELQSLSDGLEKLVAQRTAQMQKARDEALTALQIKSDFIANMSHELRTPMNGVLGILSLLQDEDVSDPQRELISIAQASGEHLLMVINDVLDFSKIEANKIDLVMKPVNMFSYVNNLCRPFALQAKEKGIEFEYHVEDDVPENLITDKLRITQIITNLLSNAIKFTQQGSVSLHFGHYGPIQDNQYRITVSDTGIGISKDKVHAVFSAFEQADTSITREFGGTGLGMNITKRLVEMFDGNIHLESELGKGTSFFVDLHLEKSLDGPIEKEGSLVIADSANLAVKASDIMADSHETRLAHDKIEGNASVLLIEDNKINQLVAKRMLENWGLVVSLAENGEQAIEQVKNNTYDMLFMDLQMPVMGGIEATGIIRTTGLIEQTTPIIAMTAHSSQEHIDECFAVGMQGHVSKPIDKQSLKSIIETFLAPVESEVETLTTGIDEKIDGVDIQDGLGRLNGDWNLFYTLINNFLEEFDNIGSLVSRSQNVSTAGSSDKDALEDVTAILHRVKGSGSNLGLTDLAAVAAKAEVKIKGGVRLSDSEIAEIEKQFMRVKNSFANVVDPNISQDASSTREESDDYLKSQMDEILINLSKDVFASEHAIQDLLLCAMQTQTAQYVNEANQALQKFDLQRVETFIKQAQASIHAS